MSEGPPLYPHFEGALRDAADVESRLVYADWLESRGAMDRADALRSYRPPLHVPPVELRVAPDPEDMEVRCYGETQLPLVILVVADFTLRPDPRPIEDRREIRVRRDNFDRVLRDHKLAFTVDLALPDQPAAEVAIRQLSDFSPEAIASQLAGSRSLAGGDLDRAVAAVVGDPRFVEAERIWRSLRMLVEDAPEQTVIEIMSWSKDDVLMDLEDAPAFERSGMFRMVNYLNHSGMQPPGAVVVGWPLSTSADAKLLGALAEVGRRRTVPVLVPSDSAFDGSNDDARHAAFRVTPGARYVALCAPSFVLRPPHPGASEPLLGPASFLVACLLSRSFEQHRSGADIRRTLRGVSLARAVAPSESALARARGYLAFISDPGGATLHDDTTCGAREEPAAGSLSLLFVLTRIAQLAMNVHYRRGGGSPLDATDAAVVAGVLERGLSTRLGHVPGLAVRLRDPRWSQPATTTDHDVELDVELAITLPLPGGERGLDVSERVLVRLGY